MPAESSGACKDVAVVELQNASRSQQQERAELSSWNRHETDETDERKIDEEVRLRQQSERASTVELKLGMPALKLQSARRKSRLKAIRQTLST